MGRLLALFIAGFIGLSLRYIILDKFELNQLLVLLAFPVASIIVLFIMKWQYNKDRDFKPGLNEKHMVTRLGDRVSTTVKQMYDENEYIGSYYRFYNKWWQRIIANIMDTPGLWYLNLFFSLSNGDQVIFKERKENKLHGNNEWLIYYNDTKIGIVRTDLSMKNITRLKESLYLEYNQNTYHYKSLGIGAKTDIYLKETMVANGRRERDSVYELRIDSIHEVETEILFMVYILFNYRFGQ